MVQNAHMAVAMIITNEESRILIAKRSADKDFGAGLWELPSGRVENGETLEEAVRRESMEELNISINNMVLVDAYMFHRNEYVTALLTYYCQFDGEIKKSEEHSELKWVDPKTVDQYFEYDNQINSVIKYLKLQNCL